MKKLVIILISPILLVSTYSIGQNSVSKSVPEFFKIIYEVPEYIYGNVKEIHSETFDAVEQDGKIVLAGKIINNNWHQMPCTFFLKPEGQIIKIDGTSLTGEWIGIFDYRVDKLDNIYWLDNDTLKYIGAFAYPNEGKIIRSTFDVQNNKSIGVTLYDIDSNGLIMNQVNKNEKGQQEGNTIVYARDDSGTITDKKVLSPDGKIIQHFDLWRYNDEGKKQKVHRSIFGGKDVDFYGATHTYEYDDKGNWIKRTSVYPNNNIRVTVRKFVFY